MVSVLESFFSPGYSSLNVMFHAKRSSSGHLGYHAVIVFDNVEKNVGGGYDGQSAIWKIYSYN